MQTGTQAVDRAATLLVAIVEATKPPTFPDLVSLSGLPKSTVSRLLSSLERNGLASRGEDGGIRPGPVLSRYAHSGRSDDELIRLARGHLVRLGQATHETINLAIPVGGAVMQIDQVDSTYVLGAVNWVGKTVPMHCSALGKVFLAHGAELPNGRLERRTDRTRITKQALAEDIAAYRARGFAVADGELEAGLIAVAAPVMGADGRPIAAISVTGPSARITPVHVARIGDLLKLETGRLSRALGHRTPDPDRDTGRQPVRTARKAGAA